MLQPYLVSVQLGLFVENCKFCVLHDHYGGQQILMVSLTGADWGNFKSKIKLRQFSLVYFLDYKLLPIMLLHRPYSE